MADVLGIKLNVISLAVIAVVVLIIFGIPLATIGFFIAKNAKLVLIFIAMLIVLNLLIKK